MDGEFFGSHVETGFGRLDVDNVNAKTKKFESRLVPFVFRHSKVKEKGEVKRYAGEYIIFKKEAEKKENK